jgi:hypothetical protein
VIGTISDAPDGDLLDSRGELAATTDSRNEHASTLFSTSPAISLWLLLGVRLLGCEPDLSYQVEHSIGKTMQQMIAIIVSVDLFVQYYVNK